MNERGNLELTFEITGYGSRRDAETLEKKEYCLSVEEIKSKRSKQQNDMLWGLIGEISNKTNTYDWDVYCQLLQMANAKYEYMLVLPDAIPMLEGQMRAVQRLHQTREVNGKDMEAVKCYYGSSKMSTKEMNVLIDKAIEIAEGYGINTDMWRYENEH